MGPQERLAGGQGLAARPAPSTLSSVSTTGVTFRYAVGARVRFVSRETRQAAVHVTVVRQRVRTVTRDRMEPIYGVRNDEGVVFLASEGELHPPSAPTP
jgi:hypothetical protein